MSPDEQLSHAAEMHRFARETQDANVREQCLRIAAAWESMAHESMAETQRRTAKAAPGRKTSPPSA